MDTATARKRLEEIRADLDRSLAILRGEKPGEGLGELSIYDQHPADSGSNLADADRVRAMIDTVEGQRRQVVAALARIDAGTYGVCVDCGRPVPEGRLEARPEAARCVACQTKRDRARR